MLQPYQDAKYFQESAFCDEYRQEDLIAVVGNIATMRSVQVVGLPGSGKSNMLRFLAAKPTVRHRYLGERADHLVCLFIDGRNPATLFCSPFSLVARQEVYSAIGHPGRTFGAAYLLFLTKLVGYCRSQGWSVLVIIDALEKAQGFPLPAHFYHGLRAIRDNTAQKQLAFIFGLRTPLESAVSQELVEISAAPHWLGPLRARDVQDSLHQHAARLEHTFTQEEMQALITWTGGYPGLLKSACELLAQGEVQARQEAAEVTSRLGQDLLVRTLCQELWDSLPQAEQRVLACGAVGEPYPAQAAYQEAAQRLLRMGLLVRTVQALQCSCTLFAQFVQQQLPLPMLFKHLWDALTTAEQTVLWFMAQGRPSPEPEHTVAALKDALQQQGFLTDGEAIFSTRFAEFMRSINSLEIRRDAQGDFWRGFERLKLTDQQSKVLGFLIQHADTVITLNELKAVLRSSGHGDFTTVGGYAIKQLEEIRGLVEDTTLPLSPTAEQMRCLREYLSNMSEKIEMAVEELNTLMATDITDNAVHQTIARLRRALCPYEHKTTCNHSCAGHEHYIQTIGPKEYRCTLT
jgi:hypothetical protein